MCGILLVVNIGTPIKNEKYVKMLSKLDPRGPDKKNYVLINDDGIEIFIGFTRLAIMDLSDNGLQPFIIDNKIYSVCNGEIYNYKDLNEKYNLNIKSKCDCEIILLLYNYFKNMERNAEKAFENTIHLLDGEFSIIIYDKEENKIFTGRDKQGVKPLFYGFNDNNLIGFSSEMKALNNVFNYINPVDPQDFYKIDITNIYFRVRNGFGKDQGDSICSFM